MACRCEQRTNSSVFLIQWFIFSRFRKETLFSARTFRSAHSRCLCCLLVWFRRYLLVICTLLGILFPVWLINTYILSSPPSSLSLALSLPGFGSWRTLVAKSSYIVRPILALPCQLSVHGSAVTPSWSWRKSSSTFGPSKFWNLAARWARPSNLAAQ